MQIILNGKHYVTEEQVNLAQLISQLTLDEAANYAVAVNYEVIPSANYSDKILRVNDQVEIVTAFQGG